MQRKKPTNVSSSAVMKRPADCADVIRRFLARTPGIDAVFSMTDDANIVHVFSVAREFRPRIYDRLLLKESKIAKAIPEIAFEFHLRAHQGREPAQCVPFEAELVYAK